MGHGNWARQSRIVSRGEIDASAGRRGFSYDATLAICPSGSRSTRPINANRCRPTGDVVMADGGNGKPKTELLDELEKGPWPSFVTEIKKTSDVSSHGPPGATRTLLRGEEGPLEARRHRGRAGLWRRRDRPLQRRPRAVSRRWRTSTPCASTSPPAGSTPATRCAPSAASGSGTAPA